ncbi:hypothetical protein [Ascidiimonas aurantiaca]|uniref:hypothetical protein n=1 Tax=Ascidiimonas aurantiaca TaxID=1685432 RepID=UPI0030EF3C07
MERISRDLPLTIKKAKRNDPGTEKEQEKSIYVGKYNSSKVLPYGLYRPASKMKWTDGTG